MEDWFGEALAVVVSVVVAEIGVAVATGSLVVLLVGAGLVVDPSVV